MKHFTKTGLLGMLWTFLSFHAFAVTGDFALKKTSYSDGETKNKCTTQVDDPGGTTPPDDIDSIWGAPAVCREGVYSYKPGYIIPPSHIVTWIAGNGGTGTISGQEFNVSWTTNGSSFVTLTEMDSSGNVIGTHSLDITINPKPSPVITSSATNNCQSSNCFSACNSYLAQYSTPLYSGSAYVWTVIGGTRRTSSDHEATVQWGAPNDSAKIIVTETNEYGCSTTYERCVTVIAKPNVFITSVPAADSGWINICAGDTIRFYDSSALNGTSPATIWSWDFGDSITAAGQNSSHVFLPGEYTIKHTAGNACTDCGGESQVNVRVSVGPPRQITGTMTVCGNGTGHYTVQAACAEASYHWNVQGGVITSPQPYGSDIYVQWGASGPGTISLKITGCIDICPATTSQTVSIIPLTLTIDGPDSACRSTNTAYSVPALPGMTYKWSLMNGSFVSDSTGNSVVVSWASTSTIGSISVIYKNSAIPCIGSAAKYVHRRMRFIISGPVRACQNSTETYNTQTTNFNTPFFNWAVTDVSGNVLQQLSSGSTFTTVNWSTFTPGNYKILLTNYSNYACNDSTTYNVTVYPLPQTPAPITGQQQVCPGGSFIYNSVTAITGTTMHWKIINGTPDSSAGNSVNVTWKPSGPYIVGVYRRMTILPFCVSPMAMDTIEAISPISAFINGPDSICKNSIQEYSASDTTAQQYVWSIGTTIWGSIISGQGTPRIKVQWNNNAGTVSLNLNVITCGKGNLSSKTIRLTDVPLPAINCPSSVCINDPVTFSGNPADSNCIWDFGDGSPMVSAPGPHYHSYATAGTYRIKLTVTTPDGCGGPYSSIKLVTVRHAPEAFISTPDQLVYCPGSTVNNGFYVSIPFGEPNSIQWYNGSTFMDTAAQYTANAPGIYTAIVTNEFGCSTTSNAIEVSIGEQPCTSGSCNVGDYSLDYTYTHTDCNIFAFNGTHSANGIIAGWNFGDPFDPTATSLSLTPTHTYQIPGVYRVSFTVKFPRADNPGEYCSRTVYYRVVVPVKGKFTYDLSCGNPGGHVFNFNNTSSYIYGHPVTSSLWLFSNGTPPTSGNPHPTGISFPAGTVQQATLTIATADGFNCTVSMDIHVPGIDSLIITGPDSICVGAPASFGTQPSTQEVNEYHWNFGDGAASLRHPTKRTYSIPGLHTVTLTIKDSLGCSRVFTKNIFVKPNTVTASITTSSLGICAGGSAMLTAASTGGSTPLQYLWNTSANTPGISVNQSGTYSVIIKDALGCSKQSTPVTIIKNAPPVAVITGDSILCSGDPAIWLYANATLGYTYRWLRNNTLLSTTTYRAQINTGYTTTGYSYTYKVIVTDVVTGCSDTSDPFKIVILPSPVKPQITTNLFPACEGSPVLISISNFNPLNILRWSNGASGNPIQVTNAGTYVATIDSNGCSRSDSVVVNPMPDWSNMISGNFEPCDSGDITITGPAGNKAFTYQWYRNGLQVAAPAGKDSDLIVHPGQNGTYTLQITSGKAPNVCTYTSLPVNIHFVSCIQPCILDIKPEWMTCIGKNITGESQYYFKYSINWGGADGAPVEIIEEGIGLANLSNLSHQTLNNGINTLTGIFTRQDTSHKFCIKITAYNIGLNNTCSRAFCMNLPKCIDLNTCNNTGLALKSLICIGKDNNGNNQYYFDYDLTWPDAQNPPILLFSSSYATIKSDPATALDTGIFNLSGIYTLSGEKEKFCFLIKAVHPVTGKVCTLADCRTTPTCQQVIPCNNITFSLSSKMCIGTDAQGNRQYLFKYISNWSGTSGSPIVDMQSSGIISNLSLGSLNNGSQEFNFVYTATGNSTTLCFDIKVADPVSKIVCTTKVCETLPACLSTTTCDGIFTFDKTKCRGIDSNGHKQYSINIAIEVQFNSGASIYATSADGGISNPTPLKDVPGGPHVVVYNFTDLGEPDTSICITVILKDTFGNVCQRDLCFDLNVNCLVLDKQFTKTSETTGGSETIQQNSKESTITVKPNPAREQTEVSYTFTSGSDHTIALMDMYGRTLNLIPVKDTKGSITLATDSYEAGVYLVTGFSGNKPVGSKRLMIIK
jgi:PKD repeat protein